MANRGLLRGRGVNPPIASYGNVQPAFIQGSYPSGHWTARYTRPTLKGTQIIQAPHNVRTGGAGQALLLRDSPGTSEVKYRVGYVQS